jgi:hypothetical protein
MLRRGLGHEALIASRWIRRAAAQPAHEALGEHPFHRGGDLVRRDPDVHEPRDRARRVVRVERRKDEVPRERCLDRDLRGLPIANLADEQNVGVLPHDRTERRCKGQPGLFVDLHLYDAVEPILDRVLDSDDVHAPLEQAAERRIEGRRLS